MKTTSPTHPEHRLVDTAPFAVRYGTLCTSIMMLIVAQNYKGNGRLMCFASRPDRAQRNQALARDMPDFLRAFSYVFSKRWEKSALSIRPTRC